ncbi:hypothetical protein V8C35DRAFT_246905 [Trichoderma chlorosporum]
MAPSQIVDDYYQILDISQSAGRDAIRASYKKLAFKRHPDRNPHNPQATAQFQLLEAAYSTLFDPERRRIYDIQYASIKSQHRTNTNYDKNGPSPQESKKGPEASQRYKPQLEKVEAALDNLRRAKGEAEKELFNAHRECNNSQAALDKLQSDADRDAQEEMHRKSWFGYFFSARQSEEDKQARQRRMVDNRAARTVREAELKRHRARVAAAQSSVDTLNGRIQDRMLEKRRIQLEAARMAEAERQAAARTAEAQRQEAARQANIRRQQEMQEERRAKAREDAERIRKQQEAERIRKEQEAERMRREQEAERMRKEQEAERMRRAQEAREAQEEWLRKLREETWKKDSQKATNANSGRASRGKTSSCQHKSWWGREEGRHLCERCLTTTSRFAFRCPSCRIVACADCRNMLKGRV